MAQERSWFLNRVRDAINIPRVDYTSSTWATSAAATDPMHPDDILGEDLYNAIKFVAADSRGRVARRRLRIIEDQWEYPLPSNCMTVRAIMHKYSNEWKLLQYIEHADFYTGFSETSKTSYPEFFSLEETTSNAVHYTGTITTADASHPPVLYDSNANFGITLSGEEIAPDDTIYNITDDSNGFVDYLTASSWKKEAQCDDGSSATTLYDADGAFDVANVAVGDIVTRTPQTADTYNGAWGIVTNVGADTLTFTRLYNYEAGFSENDYYKVGTSDTAYISAGGLIKDTEEGLVGGAEGDFDLADTYQIEDAFETLDTLLIGYVPASSDDVGTESLQLMYIPYPKEPVNHYDPIELSEAFSDAIIEKCVEYAKARERGESKPYEYLLDKGLARRRVVNLGPEGPKGARRATQGNRIYWTVDAIDYR